MRRMFAAGLVAALSLTACGGDTASETVEADPSDRTYDVSDVEKVDDIAALVPQDIADEGTLTVGASIDYAPAEFRAEDLNTAIGYDVDLAKALGRVLGLETEVVDGEFASLLPGIGSKYDIGISSFTVTDDRTASYNMISYITVGSSYAVQKGNPKGFNPDEVCGAVIGVQTGTYQEEELETFNAACDEEGKDAIEVLPYARQSDATTNLVGGKIDAFYADSTVAGYSVALTNDQLEVIGGVRDAAPQGIVVSQDAPELTEAVQQAMQHLMDEGTWSEILDSWGVEDAALDTAELNPQS